MSEWKRMCPSCIIAKYKNIVLDNVFEKMMLKDYGRCTNCDMMTMFVVREL